MFIKMEQIMKRFLALSLLPFFCLTVTGQQNITSSLSFPNIGQKPPGMTPELYAPELIATGFNERDITFSPDGKEFFYGLLTSKNITIMYSKLNEGKWTEPEVAPFARDGRFYFLEPCFSAGGKTLYLLSNRPPAKKPVPTILP